MFLEQKENDKYGKKIDDGKEKKCHRVGEESKWRKQKSKWRRINIYSRSIPVAIQ